MKSDAFSRVGGSLSPQSKAIICMNINLVLQIVYFAIAKHAVTALEIKPMDLSIVRTGFLCVMALTVAKLDGRRVFGDILPE